MSRIVTPLEIGSTTGRTGVEKNMNCRTMRKGRIMVKEVDFESYRARLEFQLCHLLTE